MRKGQEGGARREGGRRSKVRINNEQRKRNVTLYNNTMYECPYAALSSNDQY